MTLEDKITPANNSFLYGHSAAEETLLSGFNTGKMHHAWLLCGSKGIGKATLAYRLARFLLNNDKGGLFGDPDSLDTDPDLPVYKKVAAGSHPDLLVIEPVMDPKTGKNTGIISVEQARKLSSFLHKTPAESEYRIVIIDSIDDMNISAANAILKSLEEPPKKAILLLVSHQSGALLPTIRSRCQKLRLRHLSKDDQMQILHHCCEGIPSEIIPQLLSLSNGSAGLALELYEHEVLDLYQELLQHLAVVPSLDREKLFKLAAFIGAKTNPHAFRFAKFLLYRLFTQTILHQQKMPLDLIEKEKTVIQRLAAKVPTETLLEINRDFIERSQLVETIHMDKAQCMIQTYEDLCQTL